MTSSFTRALLASLLFLLPFGAAHAQVNGTTDIIVGRVTAPDGRPLAGARVEVTSLETETTRAKTTNDKGEYTVLFPDGGGQYRVRVRMLGMQPAERIVARQADEDRLVANLSLSQVPQQLAAVVSRATATPRGGERQEPGNTG
ncbi:MAG TPA: carboxypeptidase-like regulatory domain-containing protein, partial [Gemmatimonadaceae bacterium]